MDWALNPSPQTAPIMWLKGGAGAGRTSIARTIAQLCDSNHSRLAASFFFKGNDPLRSKVDSVIPTLALQIAAANPTWKRVIEESLAHDPLLLEEKSKDTQFSTLIHRPLHMTYSAGPMTPLIIVVDALDECDDYNRLHAMLHAMTNVLRQPSPIRLLLTSRPESPVVLFFRCTPSLIYKEIELKADEEANEDVLFFLDQEFHRIRSKHSDIFLEMGEWPSPHDIDWIAYKASGHFIYAATVIRFIDDDWENPADALDYIRGCSPCSNQSRRPLDELDELYLTILRRAEARGNRSNILSFLVLFSSRGRTVRSHNCLSDHDVLARALNLKKEAVILLHRNLRSLIGPIHNRIFGFLHRSFDDFLLDHKRAHKSFIGKKEYALDFGHSFWCASS